MTQTRPAFKLPKYEEVILLPKGLCGTVYLSFKLLQNQSGTVL